MRRTTTALSISAALIGLAFIVTVPASADFVIADDLIVDGSACIGFDCVNGESFGFDTLRLKENNLRIRFEDTSNSASFPPNDWELTANETTNGGLSKFSITDISGGRVPFTVEAGAPSHSLYVDDGGRIGLGTSTPVVEVHIKDGDTPTLRLEQDNSSGFTPQTWDVAGNETNYFIRDVTNGSKLPFRIRPNAPTSSIDVAATGHVGIGTTAPGFPLHVRRTDGTAQYRVEEASGTAAERTLASVVNNGPVRISLENTADSTWQIINRAAGLAFSVTGTGQSEMQLLDNGNLEVFGTVMGSIANPSSRAYKRSLGGRDHQEVLSGVLAMPLESWIYKPERSSDQSLHFGPMAEDFHQAFGLGADKSIAMADIAGVTFASIQALNSKIEQMTAERSELLEIVRRLEAQIEAGNAQ